MILFLFSFKVVQLNQTYANPRQEFEEQRKKMIEHQKKVEAEISKRMAEVAQSEQSTNTEINEYSDVKIIAVKPNTIQANSNQDILIISNPFLQNQCFCKFGSTIKPGIINANGTLTCTSPILSVGEVYLYISEDKKKWTIPTLLTVKDIAADEFATSRLLLYGSICAVGFVLYKIVTKRMKKKKGRKHKDDNPLLEEIHPHVKKSKKHSQVKEREVKETV